MRNPRQSGDCCLSEQCRVYCYYTDLDDPVHHDDTLLPHEPAVAARQGVVHLSVVERKHPTPLPSPEPLVTLLVIQVLKPLPLKQTVANILSTGSKLAHMQPDRHNSGQNLMKSNPWSAHL
jgi:hypothetical protein